MEEVRYHVMRITPVEQVAIRYLMFNLMTSWFHRTLVDVGGLDDQTFIDSKISVTFSLFRRYEEITSLMATKHNVNKAREEVLLFTSPLMEYINLAVNKYGPKNYLSPHQARYLNDKIYNLKQKVEASSHHTYTKDEIDKVKR